MPKPDASTLEPIPDERDVLFEIRPPRHLEGLVSPPRNRNCHPAPRSLSDNPWSNSRRSIGRCPYTRPREALGVDFPGPFLADDEEAGPACTLGDLFAPAPQNFFFSAAGRERKGPKRGTPPSLGHYEDLDRFRLECRCHSVATSGGHSGHSAAFSPDHDDPVTKRECRELTWP